MELFVFFCFLTANLGLFWLTERYLKSSACTFVHFLLLQIIIILFCINTELTGYFDWAVKLVCRQLGKSLTAAKVSVHLTSRKISESN